MKLNSLLSIVVLSLGSSFVFYSCDKEQKKTKDEPLVIINKAPNDAKALVGEYKATIEASSHGSTSKTENAILKLRTTERNVLTIEVPDLSGRSKSKISSFTIPNVKVEKNGAVYNLNAPEQVVNISMGKAYPEGKLVSSGSVDKDGVLSMDLIWTPIPDYSVQIKIKNAKMIKK